MQGELAAVNPLAKGFVVAPFQGPAKMIVPVNVKTSAEFPAEIFAHMLENSQDDYVFDAATALSNYKLALENAINAVNSEALKKVVISRKEHYSCSHGRFAKAFPLFANAYENAFVYFMVTQEHGSWFGASPEILVQENPGTYTTMALAGTIKSEVEIEMKDWKQKEIEEQQYVADYIAGLFEKNNLGFDRYPTTVHRTGNIHHLVTEFNLTKAQKIGLFDLATMLHPTPAVCGLPVDASRNFISEHEKYNRKLYTGYLGPVGMEGGNGFYVNLRCGQKISNGVFLYAGGGINKGSIAADELNETINKMENTWRFFN